MKFDFTFYNPTKIYFGRDALQNLEQELSRYGDNILLVYGGGSIKRIGLYDQVVDILHKCHKNIFELSGVMPNPLYTKMMEGADLVRKHSIDLILAVGGGSVIDLAKGVSVSAYSKEEPFEKYWLSQKPIDNRIVPVASILTMVGTGSEMNGGSVITHSDKKLKVGRVFPAEVYPKFSILNPEYTFSVPLYQMKSGIFDILSHLMEQYFSGDDDNVSDDLIESLIRSLIKNTKKAIANPLDYEARSNIMWISTLALNTLVGCSKEQDWEVHGIEHQISAFTDCAHGMGLAAISVPYYQCIYKDGLAKFKRFAIEVFGVGTQNLTDEEVAIKGLEALKQFIAESGMVLSIKDLGVKESMIHDIAYSCRLGGAYKKITHEDIVDILTKSYFNNY